MESRITKVFQRLKSEKELAFMPFLTAGDPDLATTQAVLQRLSDVGVDLIEIGVPYSDPIADGPVIQASYTRALDAGVRVNDIVQMVEQVASDQAPPMILMVSYAIVFRVGVERFLATCRDAKIAGLIIPDLPGAEAAEVFDRVREHEMDLIQLIAPTTPRSRVRQILSACSGFVYCVAVSGTTGERRDVADALLNQLKWLREETDLPLAVGFGISRPENVEPLRELADGVIVGSAIVRYFQKLADGELNADQLPEAIAEYAQEMKQATRNPA